MLSLKPCSVIDFLGFAVATVSELELRAGLDGTLVLRTVHTHTHTRVTNAIKYHVCVWSKPQPRPRQSLLLSQCGLTTKAVNAT